MVNGVSVYEVFVYFVGDHPYVVFDSPAAYRLNFFFPIDSAGRIRGGNENENFCSFVSRCFKLFDRHPKSLIGTRENLDWNSPKHAN